MKSGAVALDSHAIYRGLDSRVLGWTPMIQKARQGFAPEQTTACQLDSDLVMQSVN